MESSISRFASRFEKNLNNLNSRGSFNRDNSDKNRSEREYERRRMNQTSISAEQIKDLVTDSNENQLDVIQDLFYDARVDREASDKEILRAVDNNSKLLNKNFRLLNDMKDDLDSEEKIDIRSLSEENKDEILKAVFSNSDILKQVLENTEILTLLKQELIEKKAEEEKEKEENIFDKETAEKAFIDLEDHVHKENVKCYRNIQTAIAEQDAVTYGKVSMELRRIKGMVIAALVFSVADIAFLVCQYFHLI
ncbi:MAG: hypothetical protein K6E98_13220 [Lachnospiraceae bacterium]|nr:hypothetical protein [Lachnospiraceae bacterium]